MDVEIGPAQTSDAAAISKIIIAALRATNARDYSAAVIARVQRSFSPASVAQLITERRVLVARQHGRIVGTASLDNHIVRSVFVDPRLHTRGIGTKLMAAVEQSARDLGIETLWVPASITAEGFYLKRGYSPVREVIEGEERTIVMQRQL